MKHYREEDVRQTAKGAEATVYQPRRFKVYRRVTRKGQKVRGGYALGQGTVDLRQRLHLSRAASAR